MTPQRQCHNHLKPLRANLYAKNSLNGRPNFRGYCDVTAILIACGAGQQSDAGSLSQPALALVSKLQ
jgi:hypothetical protein